MLSDLETIIGEANVASHIDPEDLDKIGDRVCREFEEDLKSRKDWDDRNKEAMKLAKQVAEDKTTPWENASNVKIPLITKAAIQFGARAYPVMISGRNVFKGKVIGSDEGIPQVDDQGRPVADENGNIMWQVPPGYKRAKAERIASHMSYQVIEEGDWEEDTDRMLHGLPIVGCLFRKWYFDAEKGQNVSKLLWPDEFVVHNDTKSLETCPRMTQIFKLHPYEIEERKRAGYWLDDEIDFENDYEEEELEVFLEQHRRIDLDGDGYSEPYVVIVHKHSEKVVRVAPNFGPISYAPDGRIKKIPPLKYYTKYGFIPDPNGGFYDIGFGWLMLPLNETANTIINQLIDAGTLANRQGGFIGKGIRIGKGTLKFKPGEWKSADAPTGRIADNIFPMPIREPSGVLFNLLGMVVQFSNDISSVNDILTGQVQQATAPTTALALIEQGMRVFTGIYKRLYRCLKREGQLIFSLNAKFLTDEEYFRVMDAPLVARDDYNEASVDVVPVSDPDMVSDMARIKRAETLMTQLGNPYVNGQEITRRFFAAINVENPESLIVTPQPDPQVMIDIARLENDRLRAEASALETDGKVVEMITRSVKNLSDAKNRKDDKEIDSIINTLGLLINYRGALYAGRPGLEGQPNNAGVLPNAEPQGQGAS